MRRFGGCSLLGSARGAALPTSASASGRGRLVADLHAVQPPRLGRPSPCPRPAGVAGGQIRPAGAFRGRRRQTTPAAGRRPASARKNRVFDQSAGTVESPAVPDDQAPAEFLVPIKGADLPNPNLGVDLPAAFSQQYAREADPWPDYAGGIMPGEMRDQVRGRWRAADMTQDDLARLVGISRPQLANALQCRFGLSPDAAARLRAVVASLPVTQASLW